MFRGMSSDISARQVVETYRRLSDLISSAYFRARDAGYEVTARHLRGALESLVIREAELYAADSRINQTFKGQIQVILTHAVVGVQGDIEDG